MWILGPFVLKVFPKDIFNQKLKSAKIANSTIFRQIWPFYHFAIIDLKIPVQCLRLIFEVFLAETPFKIWNDEIADCSKNDENF